MLNLISQVFWRYAVQHLDLRKPGFALLDDAGHQIGHLDLIAIQGNRIHLEGWCEASVVAVLVNGERSQTEPKLRRDDVVAARGGDPGQALGFVLDAPFAEGRTLFSVEIGATRYIQPLETFAVEEIRKGRRRLIWRFLRDGTRALPSALRWIATRDPAAKARIKTALRFNDLPPVPQMSGQLFDGAPAPVFAPLPAAPQPTVVVPVAPPPAAPVPMPAPAAPVVAPQLPASPVAAPPPAPVSAPPPVPQPAAVPDRPMPAGLMQTAITIILPIYNAFELLPEVLDRVARHTDLPARLILIEDCSTDPQVRPFLRDWVARQTAFARDRVVLIENAANKGFIRSVNAGLAQAVGFGDHVVLLNSDAFVPKGWASRLIRPILAHDNVASVTPMSNDAEIYSVPVICQRTVLAPGEADRLDDLARQFHPDADLAAAPTGVGFCMAMNFRYLVRVPQFDTGFGRGYGEEVDWCQKLRALGGRHLGLPGLFVEHRGGTSFGNAEKLKLVQTNNAIISRRYPPYDQEVQDFIKHDPMATPRLALAIAWAAGRQVASGAGPLPIYLAHNLGGGAEDYLKRRIADDIARAEGGAAIVLRIGSTQRWRLELHSAMGAVGGVTHDFEFIQRLLAPVTARRIVYSCGVGDSDPVSLPAHLLALAAGGQSRIEVLFHDFFPVSPSYTLLSGAGTYEGLPDPATSTDPAHRSRRPDGRAVTLAEWQAAWGQLLMAADEITVFSQDSRTLVAAVWPQKLAAIMVRPHRLLAEVPRVTPLRRPGQRPVIGVLGNIGYQKGAGVLADLSRDLAASGAADLVVIGNLDPAYALVPPARVHGTYRIVDIPDLVQRYGISCWLMPSIWPETFSYATHEALATGLPVWCFDLGAQGEAVRAATLAGAPGGVLPSARGPALTKLILDVLSRVPAREAS